MPKIIAVTGPNLYWEKDLLAELEKNNGPDAMVQIPANVMKQLLLQLKNTQDAIERSGQNISIYDSPTGLGVEIVLNGETFRLEYVNEWMSFFSNLDTEKVNPLIAAQLAHHLNNAMLRADDRYDSRLDAELETLTNLSTRDERKII